MQSESELESESESNTNSSSSSDSDIFLNQIANPSGKFKANFIKRKFNQIHGISEEDALSTDNHQFRPALLTQMIKSTRYPHKLLSLWIRDREKCPIDHINTSAAIVHLSQLCLDKVQPDQIYDNCMSWSVIRLSRDLFKFIAQYDMRHIANIMWSLGVITSNMSDGGSIHFVPKSGSGNSNNIKIHRDFRRLAAKLLIRFENDTEIKRKCNVQNMVDMLWAMNCVGLKVHHFFYQFCIDLYCKLDIDIGVTPDALAYLGVLYATRLKLKEKIKIKPKKKATQVDMLDLMKLKKL